MVVSPLKRDEAGYYTMDLEDFESKAKEGAKYFILCNPHNPVGRAWTPEELKAVGDICVKYGVGILPDEIHSDLMLDGRKHTCMASVSPDVAALQRFCVEKAGVAFGKGTDFGSGFLRLNAACPRSTIEKALTQLEAALRAR